MRPWTYAISDGSGWAGWERVRAAGAAGVDFLQVREKQLPLRELLAYCRKLRAALAGMPVKLLVNGRYDVAQAAGLDGVHCPAHGVSAARLRPFVPPGFLLAQSCHSAVEVHAAFAADFCVLGPIFATPSKLRYGPPLGLDELEAAAGVGPPVLALGGISPDNAADCLRRGARGVAGIRLFADLSADPAAVAQLQRNW